MEQVGLSCFLARILNHIPINIHALYQRFYMKVILKNYMTSFFSISRKFFVGKYCLIPLPYKLIFSKGCVFLVLLRFTKRFPVTDAGPPLMLISSSNLSLSSVLKYSPTPVYFKQAFQVKLGVFEE